MAITGAIAAGAAVTTVGVYAAHLVDDIRICLLVVSVVAVTSASIGVTLLPEFGFYALVLTVCVTAGMLAHHYLANRDSPLDVGGRR